MAAKPRGKPNSFIVLCVYVAAYVILDRISLLQALPNIGFTLWNPRRPAVLHCFSSKAFGSRQRYSWRQFSEIFSTGPSRSGCSRRLFWTG